MAYRMTPARRRALKKAQAISARKRRGKGRGKLAAANRRARRNRNIAVATGGLALAAMAAGYTNNRSLTAHLANEKRVSKKWARLYTKQVVKTNLANMEINRLQKLNGRDFGRMR